ncbi:MAG: hypothetical protein ACPLW9_00875 [Minisyncoccales bacterium]
MNSEEKKQLGPLWLECFNDDMRAEFEECIKYDEFIAKNIFWTAWQRFKYLCYKQDIILDKSAVLELFNLIMPHKEIWLPLIDADEDFLIFHQMKIRKEEEKEYSQANTQTREQLDYQGTIRVLIRQIMLQTTSTLQLDRREFFFYEELKMLINQIIDDRISCSIGLLKKLLNEEINDLPSYLLNMVDKFASRLSEVKTEAVKPEIEEIKLEIIPLPPKPATPLEPPALVIHEPVVNFNGSGNPTIMMSTMCYEITKQGLKQAFEAMIPYFEPLDFYRKVKNLLSKIEAHCRNHHVLNNLLKIIHELKNDYCVIYNKDDKSPLGLKKGYIYSALSLFECGLSEKLAPFFKGEVKRR